MALHVSVSSPGNNCVSALVHPTADAAQTMSITHTLPPKLARPRPCGTQRKISHKPETALHTHINTQRNVCKYNCISKQ